MTVVQAEEGMDVEADTVYLIPPKKVHDCAGGQADPFGLCARHAEPPHRYFFSSLAEERREHSIVVVLSGTGTDGTNGVKAVKEHGGLVIAQSPESAKFDGMPRA